MKIKEKTLTIILMIFLIASQMTSRMSEWLLRKISIGKSCHNLTHLPEFSARCYDFINLLSKISLGMLTYVSSTLINMEAIFIELRCCGILTKFRLNIIYYQIRYFLDILILFLMNSLSKNTRILILYKDVLLELFQWQRNLFIKCSLITECFLTTARGWRVANQ